MRRSCRVDGDWQVAAASVWPRRARAGGSLSPHVSLGSLALGWWFVVRGSWRLGRCGRAGRERADPFRRLLRGDGRAPVASLRRRPLPRRGGCRDPRRALAVTGRWRPRGNGSTGRSASGVRAAARCARHAPSGRRPLCGGRALSGYEGGGVGGQCGDTSACFGVHSHRPRPAAGRGVAPHSGSLRRRGRRRSVANGARPSRRRKAAKGSARARTACRSPNAAPFHVDVQASAQRHHDVNAEPTTSRPRRGAQRRVPPRPRIPYSGT